MCQTELLKDASANSEHFRGSNISSMLYLYLLCNIFSNFVLFLWVCMLPILLWIKKISIQCHSCWKYTLRQKNEAPRRSYPTGTKISRCDVYVQKNKWLQFQKTWIIYSRERGLQSKQVNKVLVHIWPLCKQLFALVLIHRVGGCPPVGYRAKFCPIDL